MKLILGPMEGVLDGAMRELLTAINPYDWCVTEFLRVVNLRFPAKAFYQLCPELYQGGKTRAGTPVRVQLLGQSPQYMAENAVLACELGSYGIDINFGCPSKTVNDHLGGAALLKDPEQIYQILKTVRYALPDEQQLSAKIRLGFDDCSAFNEIVDAVIQGGAKELTVHGRSRQDGYQADKIRWDLIGQIRDRVNISVIANGEIWNKTDALKCMDITHCQQLMVCRGALSMPNLGAHIKWDHSPLCWPEIVELLLQYADFNIQYDKKGLYYSNRIKQWLRYLRPAYPQASDLFIAIRQFNERHAMIKALQQMRETLELQDAVCS